MSQQSFTVVCSRYGRHLKASGPHCTTIIPVRSRFHSKPSGEDAPPHRRVWAPDSPRLGLSWFGVKVLLWLFSLPRLLNTLDTETSRTGVHDCPRHKICTNARMYEAPLCHYVLPSHLQPPQATISWKLLHRTPALVPTQLTWTSNLSLPCHEWKLLKGGNAHSCLLNSKAPRPLP